MSNAGLLNPARWDEAGNFRVLSIIGDRVDAGLIPMLTVSPLPLKH